MKLPQLGEDVAKGVVLSVLVSPGEHVDKDQTLLELETDKATTEVPSEYRGTVEQVHVEEGQEVSSGDDLITISEDTEETNGQRREARQEEEPGEQREARQEEARGERRREPRERREKPDRGRESKEKRKEKDAKRRKPPREQREEPAREPEEPVDEVRSEEREEREEREQRERAPRLDQPVPASPSVRRFARELGVDISEVAATGADARLTEDDVKSHVRRLVEMARRVGAEEQVELPDFGRWGQVHRESMNAIRKATAEGVAKSWEKIPHVTQYDKADITGLDDFRKRYAGRAEKAGGKLTVTAILVKVAAAALKNFPRFNASLDLERTELVFKDYVHIGVAVDTEHGLLKPVIRDVDQKGLIRVAAELTEASRKARGRELSSEEMAGGTFSITNLGGMGTTRFTPIISWPEVAILSVGKSETKPVWRDEEWRPRTILPLGITYDHRAVDGANASRFLRWIAEVLEDPLRLTMEG